MTPRISVIIVNYNAGDWLSRNVKSVVEQTFKDFECFIVDNGSTDGSLGALPALDKRFHIIEAGENLGFAAGNNLAAKKAIGDWIVLLNPDAFARPDWLEKILEATQLAANVTMVGSTQYMALEPSLLDGVGDCYHISGLAWRAGHMHSADNIPPTCEVFAPCAAASAYRRDVFERMGGFDERFFCYHEDVDLAFRMRLDGGTCVQSAEAIVDHVSSGISGRASDFAVYHGTRNRIWTFVKNMPGLGLILFTPALLAVNMALVLWALAVRRKRLRPTLRGIWHGLKGTPNIWGSRKAIHKTRKIGFWGLLPFMAVNPIKVVKRKVHSRPLPDKANL